MLNLLLWPAKAFFKGYRLDIRVFLVSFCCGRSLRAALTVGGYSDHAKLLLLGTSSEMLLQAVALDSC